MEGNCCGLTYCGCSRPTTIGKVGESDLIPTKSLDSALYFRAGTFPEGIQHLTVKSDGVELYKKVKERNMWVNFLKSKETQYSYSTIEESIYTNWFKTTEISVEKLIQLIRWIEF